MEDNLQNQEQGNEIKDQNQIISKQTTGQENASKMGDNNEPQGQFDQDQFDPKEFLKVFSAFFLPYSFIFLAYLVSGVSLDFSFNLFIFLDIFLVSIFFATISELTNLKKLLRFVMTLSGVIIGLLLGIIIGKFVFVSILYTKDSGAAAVAALSLPVLFFQATIVGVVGGFLTRLLANELWPREREKFESKSVGLVRVLIFAFEGAILGAIIGSLGYLLNPYYLYYLLFAIPVGAILGLLLGILFKF